MSHKPLFNVKAVLYISWGLALLVILLFLGPQKILASFCSVTPHNIREFVSSFGMLSALVYISLLAVRSFFFLPVTPFTIAGGFLFGPVFGLVFTVVGRMLSATITFSLSRYLLRDYVKSRVRGKYAGFEARLEKGGIFYIAILRMVPMLPFDVVGYAAGVSSIRFKKYLFGTLMGDLPGVFAYTLLGSSLSEPGSSRFYLSIIIALIVAVLSWLFMILYIRKCERKKVDGTDVFT